MTLSKRDERRGGRLSLATAAAAASAVILLAASAHAQSGQSGAISATAQPGDGDHASQRWHLTPQVQPLMAYLRCEEVPLNRFGEAEHPIKALSFLAERFHALEAGREPLLIPLEVWPGIRAQLQVLAGYGFFGVVQFYATGDREGLFKALTAAGWALKRVPSDAAAQSLPALALVPVYRASKPMGKLARELTLMDAYVDQLAGTVAENGLTVICTYRKMDER